MKRPFVKSFALAVAAAAPLMVYSLTEPCASVQTGAARKPSFLAGIVSVIYLEIQGLQALLDPFRDLLTVLIPGG